LNAKGAATMIRSPVFKQLGMDDDSYFMYQEETDFCYRAWLAGYRVVFAPKAIVWHAFNTPLKKTKQFYSFYAVRFYGCRNYIMTLLKNLSFGNLLWILPFHILGWLILSIAFLCKGKFKDSFWIIKAIFWNIFHFPSIMKKRSIVQKQIRKIPDNQFLEKVMTTKPASFYLRKAGFYILGIPFKK
jgi:GT2 family glycosyltransferase